MKRICFIIALLTWMTGVSVTAQVSHFSTFATARTGLDSDNNWKPWSDWLPMEEGHVTIDRDNMTAGIDIDSWGTHISMRIDSTAESIAGYEMPLFTYYCTTSGSGYNGKQYNIEILAYSLPESHEAEYQYTVYFTDVYSSIKFLARKIEAAE